MLKDFSKFSLSELFEDMTDYLVLVDGVLEEMPNSDPDYKSTLKIEEHINGVLEAIDEIWEAQGDSFN